MLHSRQHFRKGRLMVRSSPENEIGLIGIIQPASRIKNFTLDEQLNSSYIIDNRFLLLLCCFTIWWAYLPLG